MQGKKKCLFIVHGLNAGGIENYLLRFLKYSEDRLEATVYCKSGSTGILEPHYRQSGVNILSRDIGKTWILRYWNFKKYLQSNDFQSIVDFTGDFAGVELFVSKKAGVGKRIVFYRNSSYRFNSTFIKVTLAKMLNTLVYNYATRILANSKSAFNFYFNDRVDDRFLIIQNGIDVKSFFGKKMKSRNSLGIREDAIIIGHVGRYNPAKNHETIFKVAKCILEAYSNVVFVLCGKNVDQELVNRSMDNNKDQVIALGYRADIAELLPLFNIFYFPSKSEGQPNALIEAMALGLNIVSSNIEPIKDTVPEYLRAQLCDPEDVDAQVKAIENALKTPYKVDDLLAEWTSVNYDSAINFEKFYVEL